ncbi:MAG: hypothetical protein V4616_13780 [Bacteroidota bacterium]
MKHIRLILASVFTLALITGNGQVHIEKRKHLKGYNIERTRKADKVSDIKIKDGERVTAADVAKADAKAVAETPNTVVLPVAESSFYNQNTVTTPATRTETADLVAAKPLKNKLSDMSMFRKGAGLIMAKKIDNVRSSVYKAVPAVQAGPGEVFAIIGFVAGILSILSFLGPGLIFFGVIGLIFSILGLDSAYSNFARWGLILSIIGLVLALVYLIAWAAYWPR